jgi:hypothetical protein
MSFVGRWGVADMFNRSQFDSCGSGEVRVQSQYVDRELDLIDDALAGAVTARKEFEIRQKVVLPITVSVVNSFLRVKFAAEVLAHHVAMFQHFCFLAIIGEGRNGKPYVSVFLDMASYIARIKSVQRRNSGGRRFARLTTVFLFSVYAKSRGGARSVHEFVTVFTNKLVSFVGAFSATNLRADYRAVQGIAVEFFTIRFQMRLHHRKRLPAFFAGESNRCSAGRIYLAIEMIAAAFETAIFAAVRGFAWVAVKFFAAVHAIQFEGHGYRPFMSQCLGSTCATRTCQVAYAGMTK